MEITINNELLDFQLEQEATLGEIIDAIEHWLGDAGMCIRSVDTDGTTIDLAAKLQWQALDLTGISRVDVVAQTPFEFRAEKLKSLYEYFVTLRDASADSPKVVEDLISERTGVQELLAELLTSEIASGWIDLCERMLATEPSETAARGRNEAGATLGVDTGLFGTPLAGLSRFSSEIVPVLEARYYEIASPDESLRKLLPVAYGSIRELSDVAAFLQTGEDGQAMQRVLRFLEVAQSLMRILYALRERRLIAQRYGNVPTDDFDVSNEQIGEHQSELTGLLDELSEAIDDGDTITIGDLLEYEIGPRFLDILDTLGAGIRAE